MLKRVTNKLKKTKGSIAVIVAVGLPVILGTVFLGIDIVRYNNAKNDLQRRTDAAVLTIVNEAEPYGDETFTEEKKVDVDGNEYGTGRMIISESPTHPDRVGSSVCEIQNADIKKGIDLLKEDVRNMRGLVINNASSDEQMEDGIARIEASGKYNKFMINYLPFMNLDVAISAESYAICNSTVSEEGEIYVPSNDKWNIYYELNGGTWNSESAAEGHVPSVYGTMSTVILPIPIKEDYVFNGWYKNEDFSGDKITKISGISGDSGDITVYAKWDNNPDFYCTVKFIDNLGNAVGVDDVVLTGKHGDTILFTEIPEVYGYNKPENINITLDTDGKDVYLTYTVINYQLNINLNGGVWDTKGSAVEADEDIIKYNIRSGDIALGDIGVPKKGHTDGDTFINDYTFTGWFKDEECLRPFTGIIGGTSETAYQTIYAGWAINQCTVIFHYVSISGKQLMEPTSVSREMGTVLNQPAPDAPAGYKKPNDMHVYWDENGKIVTFVYEPKIYSIVYHGDNNVTWKNEITVEDDFELPIPVKIEEYLYDLTFNSWHFNDPMLNDSTRLERIKLNDETSIININNIENDYNNKIDLYSEWNGGYYWRIDKTNNKLIISSEPQFADAAIHNDKNGLLSKNVSFSNASVPWLNEEGKQNFNQYQIEGNLSDLTTVAYWFANSENITMDKINIATGSIDWTKIKNMNGMFYNSEIDGTIDLSSWDMSNVESIQSMFDGCKNLDNIIFGTQTWNKMKNIRSFVNNIRDLKTIDLTNVTGNVNLCVDDVGKINENETITTWILNDDNYYWLKNAQSYSILNEAGTRYRVWKWKKIDSSGAETSLESNAEIIGAGKYSIYDLQETSKMVLNLRGGEKNDPNLKLIYYVTSTTPEFSLPDESDIYKVERNTTGDIVGNYVFGGWYDTLKLDGFKYETFGATSGGEAEIWQGIFASMPAEINLYAAWQPDTSEIYGSQQSVVKYLGTLWNVLENDAENGEMLLMSHYLMEMPEVIDETTTGNKVKTVEYGISGDESLCWSSDDKGAGQYLKNWLRFGTNGYDYYMGVKAMATESWFGGYSRTAPYSGDMKNTEGLITTLDSAIIQNKNWVKSFEWSDADSASMAKYETENKMYGFTNANKIATWEDGTVGEYWLRDPVEMSITKAEYVDTNGNIHIDGKNVEEKLGVRALITLNLNAISSITNDNGNNTLKNGDGSAMKDSLGNQVKIWTIHTYGQDDSAPGEEDEYTKVEYIQSTEKTYIDLKYQHTYGTQFELDCFVPSASDGMLFGSREWVAYKSFVLYKNGTSLKPLIDNLTVSMNDVDFSKRLYIEMDNKHLKVNDINLQFPGECLMNTNSVNDYLLSSMDSAGGTWGINGVKVYGFKIKMNGIVIRDMIPAIKKNTHEIGMLDVLHNEFYPNVGEEEFVVGPQIS